MMLLEPVKKNISLVDILPAAGEFSEDIIQSLNQVKINGISLDSRAVNDGDLFLAFQGQTVDSRGFIEAAALKGAAAVICQSDNNRLDWMSIENITIPLLHSERFPAAIGEIISLYCGEPSKKLTVIGITGTNGKTSCATFIRVMLSALNCNTGSIGTLGVIFKGWEQQVTHAPLLNTTPDALTLQTALYNLEQQECEFVALEVSSVAVHQQRISGVSFDTAVFTNLSLDHLDYHVTFENYKREKLKFLKDPAIKRFIVNMDDPVAEEILALVPGHAAVFGFGLQLQEAEGFYLKNAELNAVGMHCLISTPEGDKQLQSRLLGRFNISNLLAATATLYSQGFVLDEILKSIGSLEGVPGRMEKIVSDDITVFVDFAHTPDALEKSLDAVDEHFTGKVHCVFGCGGNRDVGKRPEMGRIAEKLAGKVYITSDNPRQEAPEDIARDILAGINHKKDIIVEHDRAKAIELAVINASSGDVLLIAGKGHENYQDVEGKKSPYSDYEEVARAMKKRLQICS